MTDCSWLLGTSLPLPLIQLKLTFNCSSHSPCSVHDPAQAIEYAKLLKPYADAAKDDLLILMRVYFEKPRTTVGWKGLCNDPEMTGAVLDYGVNSNTHAACVASQFAGTFQINKGLKIARQLLLDLTEMGVPTACEFLGE